jgi:superfamily II DNA or RNA helicase
LPTTSLAQALSRECTSAIRQRGTSYFYGGRVRITSGSAWRLVATVRGSSAYRVEMAREGATVRATCSCPYFDVSLCKHIWATVLAADAQQLLLGDGDNGNVQLVHPLGAEPAPPGWRNQMAQLQPAALAADAARHDEANGHAAAEREPLYLLDTAGTRAGSELSLEILTRERRRDDSWGKARGTYLSGAWLQRIHTPEDRQALNILTGATPLYGRNGAGLEIPGFNNGTRHHAGTADEQLLPFRYRLREAQLELLLPLLCHTGRCFVRARPQDPEYAWLPMSWDAGEPWHFGVEVRRAGADVYLARGVLSRGAERMDLGTPLLLLESGFVVTRQQIARVDHHDSFDWVRVLCEHGSLRVPAAQSDEFLTELLRQPRLPPLDLPPELRYEQISCAPRPRLAIRAPRERWRRDRLQGSLSFDYAGTMLASDDPASGVVQAPAAHTAADSAAGAAAAGGVAGAVAGAALRRVLLRDRAGEQRAAERLRELGWIVRAVGPGERQALELAVSRLPQVVAALIGEGWHIEAEGRLYRAADRIDIRVTSSIDWFELHGSVDFGGTVAHLPALLAAARRGEHMVRLGDGSYGLLPQEWLGKYGLLAGLGSAHEDHMRFTRGQVGLLDALLSAQPEASCDALFTQVREQLIHFAGVQPAQPPAGFRGDLRPYQKEGLGWLQFLCRFGFGGCLADDMGLGKTVQVLALLQWRREAAAAPSLVVVPKSLVFNWKQEAARFAPALRVLDHTGVARRRGNGHFDGYDVVLTTYGTLRRDALDFKDARFDYVILDEAQAIKNADSVSAKAARLLQADHRLALSGTPVENHLGELWSLFEFLNPGMLGSSSVFRQTQTAWRNPDQESRRLVSQVLRPFLLRRTKQQVLPDLPPKVEQTLYCELDRRQRRLYDELRDHYRAALQTRIEASGIGRSKIQILEALLRLRQAAIHPGLLDAERAGDASAKLDVLLPRLREVLEEGHKTLVFSQFTRMLAILRTQLDRDGIEYAYLDGRTRDREACVNRFQTDPACRLFLVSLKAGGHGLNLTAAQYVFLLDPWWNPAVEAQAIDRAHRIGQANRVFAYRLIARDTIEEKVLELQSAKRELADAIVGADGALISRLSREDLERLLS